MGVSIYLLVSNNSDAHENSIYFLANDITDESKKRLITIVEERFERRIVFIEFTSYKERLKLSME